MQQRRYRPGDVLDDYCPRERRITDHAIVAMIDDDIKQTRCVVCDAEHEYKDGKVPPQRRKKPKAALFAQVLDGLQGPQPARVAAQGEPGDGPVAMPLPDAVLMSPNGHEPAPSSEIQTAAAEPAAAPVSAAPVAPDLPPAREDGPWRRQLIRAALPRPEGQQPAPARPVPEFTVRQPTIARGQRHARRRSGAQGQGQGSHHGPIRAGRGGPGQAHGGRTRRRRGGKKNQ